MCIENSMICKCGSNVASLHFRGDLMTPEVIDELYCPECAARIIVDRETMIYDNGWVLSYIMDMARFLGKNLAQKPITPEFLFDEGYCTWSGLYPTDHWDSVTERQQLVHLAETDKMKYFSEFKKWSLERMDRLAREGWRKAGERHEVAH